MREIKIDPIRSIDRAIDILEAFSGDRPALSVDEISKITSLPKSTAYRILCTLERRDLVKFDENSLQYKPGLKLIELGFLFSSLLDLRQESEEILTDLQQKTNQTVLMAVGVESQIAYISRKESTKGLKYSSFVGERRPYLYGVLGPAMLAFLPEKQIENILDQGIPVNSENTITDRDAILKRLEQIRKDQFFIEEEETNIGVTGIGAPIFNSLGEAIAAIGVIGPSIQLAGDQLEQAKVLLIEASKKISGNMGYKYNPHDVSN